MNFGGKGKGQAKPKNRVGLDIGNSAVKILEISTVSDKSKLVALGIKKIQDQSKESLANAIKNLTEESKVTSKNAIISISGSNVIVRFVLMPKMTDDELKSAIKFEAEKFIPFNINDCVLGFQTLRKEERENKLSVLLVAAKKGYIEERIALVESCGFSVSIVDVDSFALANSFTMNMPKPDPDKTYALLNIGAKVTSLSILKNGMIYLVRDMPTGSRDIDIAISKSLGVDAKAAEEIKLNPPAEKAEEAANCAKTVFNNLVDEMRLPFSYYENQFGKGVDDIYISGGGSALAGIEDMFQDAFGSKPIFWNPTQFLDTSSLGAGKDMLDKMNQTFAISAGLAIR